MGGSRSDEAELAPGLPCVGARRARCRLVMEPAECRGDAYVVQAVARKDEAVPSRSPAVIGALLPMSYSAGDASGSGGRRGPVPLLRDWRGVPDLVLLHR